MCFEYDKIYPLDQQKIPYFYRKNNKCERGIRRKIRIIQQNGRGDGNNENSYNEFAYYMIKALEENAAVSWPDE